MLKKLLFLAALVPSVALGQVPGVAGGAKESLCAGAPFSACTADITDTTSTLVKAAGGAQTRFYIYSITVSNMDDTVNTRVDILDGATKRWMCPAAALGGGCSVIFPSPLIGSLNTAINAQAATTGATVQVCVAGCAGN